MYHNVQSLHKEMPKTTKCTVKSVKLMIRRPTRIYGVSNTSQKFRDGFLAVSALLSLSSSQAQMNGRPQRDYAYILAQMKVQFVRLFLKPPLVVLAHLDNSVASWRCVLWPFVPWPFVLVAFCLEAFCPVAFCLYPAIGERPVHYICKHFYTQHLGNENKNWHLISKRQLRLLRETCDQICDLWPFLSLFLSLRYRPRRDIYRGKTDGQTENRVQRVIQCSGGRAA